MIKDMLETWGKLQTGKITYDDIKELQKQEEQLTKLIIVGYDKEEAKELLKQYSFDYLYEKAVLIKSDVNLSDTLYELGRKEEHKRIMNRKRLFMSKKERGFYLCTI